MRNFMFLTLIILPIFSSAQVKVESNIPFIVMYGPTLHIRLDSKKIIPSVGLEASCWLNDFQYYDAEPGGRDLPMGFDIGIEWENQMFRAYSEFQAGRVLYGAAIGPVFQFNKQSKERDFGFQGSLWANAMIGFNARCRYVNDTAIFTPGTYIKVPVVGSYKVFGE